MVRLALNLKCVCLQICCAPRSVFLLGSYARGAAIVARATIKQAKIERSIAKLAGLWVGARLAALYKIARLAVGSKEKLPDWRR